MVSDNYDPQEITDNHIKIATEAWNELLKKGELNIGRVLYKNIFQIQPTIMNLCNPTGLEQTELFKDPTFLELCSKTIKGIGMAVDYTNQVYLYNDLSSYLHNIDAMIRMLIDLGRVYYEKGF